MSVSTQVSPEEKRQIALRRAEELRRYAERYLEASARVPTGFALTDQFYKQKERIKALFGASEEDWNDWHWQLRNRITKVEQLAEIINLSDREVEDIAAVGARFRWAISPYYASLMDPDDPSCPIRLRAVPTRAELEDPYGVDDPMAEEFTSPAPLITRRYPDRLIINVTNQCATFCRHCQRRRNIGEVDVPAREEDIEAALDYIRRNREIRDVLITIRDVLITGGDPLTLSDDRLDWILGELDRIGHVEIKRIGSAMPVTLPQRITPELCRMLEKHHPLYLNTQFNHPKEITPEALQACSRLAKAGIGLGNQAVLLKGINNDPVVMKKLCHELLRIHVRPYYIFHAKQVKLGFETPGLRNPCSSRAARDEKVTYHYKPSRGWGQVRGISVTCSGGLTPTARNAT
jgi:lysine 2,3-aminomutase